MGGALFFCPKWGKVHINDMLSELKIQHSQQNAPNRDKIFENWLTLPQIGAIIKSSSKERAKKLPGTGQEVSDMAATKEQERKALEKIKKIVEELGEDSYIGMAFEGCFEIAEENIENDFGCSMKQRAEAAEKKLKTAELDNRDLRNSIADLKSKYAGIESKVLTTAEAGAIKAILSSSRMEAANMADSTAQRIVELADNPDSAEFRQAVQDNRKSKKRLEDCDRLIQRLLDTMK